MHRIYSSLALVLDGKSYGEADRLVTLYTREYGLVRALAKSARLQKSKMRYALNSFTLAEISMVKGKELWRLTGAVHEKAYRYHHDEIKKVFSMLKRLLGDEVHDVFLFDSLKNYLEYASLETTFDDRKIAEIGIVLHILNRSGYIPASQELAAFLSKPFDQEALSSIEPHKKQAIGYINQALRHAHL